MKPARLTATLALLLAAQAGLAATEVTPGATLESLLAVARSNNPEFAAMQQEVLAAQARSGTVGALPDPMLKIELENFTNTGNERSPSLLPNQVEATRYQISQAIPWFGKRALQRDVANAQTRQAEQLSSATWQELAMQIKTAYSDHYYVVNNQKITQELLGLLANLEKIAQVRYASGLAAQQDVIRAQLEQTAMKRELLTLERDKQQIKSRLNALLNRPSQAALAEPESLRPLPPAAQLSLAQLETRAQEHNPQLFAASASVDAARKTRELVQKNRYPDFNIGLSAEQMGGEIKAWGLMLEMSLPWQRKVLQKQEQEAAAMLNAAQSRREANQTQISSALAEKAADLQLAEQSEMLIRTSLLPQSELTFKSALSGYENGKVDFATVLEAQRQIRQARQEQLRLLVDAQKSLAEIERLTGDDL